MDFCKTVREFDCTKFTVGVLYYVHWRDCDGKDIKQIYLCDDVDTEGNQILLKKVVALQGFCPYSNLRLGQEDVNNIVEIQEVEIETEYNVSWREWEIRADIQPEASNATAKAFASFLDDKSKTFACFSDEE